MTPLETAELVASRHPSLGRRPEVLAALMDALAVQVPDGWAIVPVEPTSLMLGRGEGVTDFILPAVTHDNTSKGRMIEMRMAWHAMLAAAPSPLARPLTLEPLRQDFIPEMP